MEFNMFAFKSRRAFLMTSSFCALLLPQQSAAELICEPSENGDCIVITQSAETKGVGANEATITVDGSATTILPIGTIAQFGDDNSAIFEVLGNVNTVYFSQIGNSLMTMTIHGDDNLVSVGDFGGSDIQSKIDLSIIGEANTVSVNAANISGIAALLDIALEDSMAAFVEIEYDEFSKIVTSISGLASSVKMRQSNEGMLAQESTGNVIELKVRSDEDANIVNILQEGIGNTATVTLTGSLNELIVNQITDRDSRFTALIDVMGNNNFIEFEQSHGEGLFAELVVLGDDNEIDVDQRHGWGLRHDRVEVFGNANHLVLRSNAEESRNDLRVSGDSNTVHTDLMGMWADSRITLNGRHNSAFVFSEVGMNLDVKGDGNNTDVTTEMMHWMMPHHDFTYDAISVSLDGNDNDVHLNYRIDGMMLDFGVPRSKTVVSGNSNDIDWNAHSWADFFMGVETAFATTIEGDHNSIHTHGYFDLMMGGSTENENYAYLKLNGFGNTLDIGNVGYRGVRFDVFGDHNRTDIRDTNGLNAWIAGSDNLLHINQLHTEGRSYVAVNQSHGDVHIDGVDGKEFILEVNGEHNTVGVGDVYSASLNTFIAGSGNDLFADDLHNNLVLTSKIEGNDNFVKFQGVASGLDGLLTTTVLGDANTLRLVGSPLESTYDGVIQSIDVIGDGNMIDLALASSIDLDVDGYDNKLDIRFDESLGIYIPSLTEAGSGSITISTLDGSIAINSGSSPL